MRRSRLPLSVIVPKERGTALPPSTPSAIPTGTLFVVSLPIGNPEDITLRALRVLGSADLIVAENVRSLRSLLTDHPLAMEIVSLRPRHGDPALIQALACLREGRDVALVVDNGTPAFVDPGLKLIQAALQEGHRVTAVPGATACIAALTLSGLSPAPFSFFGFPPRSLPKRSDFFACIGACHLTLILYEYPRYLRSTLLELCRQLGGSRKIVVACDITHTKERIFRGTISEALAELAGGTQKGGYTLVIASASSSADA